MTRRGQCRRSVVVFASTATNLIAGQSDGNGATDIFVFDRSTGDVTLASHAASGASTTAGAASYFPSISADGAYAVFVSQATNLVSGHTDTNADADVFLFDRTPGRVTLVSHTAASATTAGRASVPRRW